MRNTWKSTPGVQVRAVEPPGWEQRREQSELDKEIGRWVNEGGRVKDESVQGATGLHQERRSNKANRHQ
jgi:hypothetical protein